MEKKLKSHIDLLERPRPILFLHLRPSCRHLLHHLLRFLLLSFLLLLANLRLRDRTKVVNVTGDRRVEFTGAIGKALAFCMRLLLLVDQHARGNFYTVIAVNIQTKIAPDYSISLACNVTSVFIRGLHPQAPQPLTVWCSVRQF